MASHTIYKLCPNIDGKSLLYVGFNQIIPTVGIHHKKWWYDLFSEKGFTKFTILEVFPENVRFAIKYFEEENIPIDVVEGNVLDASEIFKENQFDVSVFWHGPEHLPLPEIDVALQAMEKVSSKFVIIGCPNGMSIKTKQGKLYGNPYEEHISGANEDFYKQRGFLTEEVIRKGFHPHLTAIKVLGDVKKWSKNNK